MRKNQSPTEETREKLRIAALNRTRNKWTPEQFEKVCTPLDKDAVQAAYEEGLNQEEVAQLFGTTRSVIGDFMRRHNIPARHHHERTGPLSNRWKGDNASYVTFHERVMKLKGRPRKCEICGIEDIKTGYEWANLTGRLDDPSDYKRMCHKCHWEYDKEQHAAGMKRRKAKRTHCKHEHELTDDNVYISRGYRLCRICRNTDSNARAKRKRLEARQQH